MISSFLSVFDNITVIFCGDSHIAEVQSETYSVPPDSLVPHWTYMQADALLHFIIFITRDLT